MGKTLLSLATALVAAGTVALVPPSRAEASPSAPLAVWMYCEYGYCEATASGGSGSYSFSWNNANKLSEDWGPISSAEPICYSSGNISISVTVTDSNNATAYASRWYTQC